MPKENLCWELIKSLYPKAQVIEVWRNRHAKAIAGIWRDEGTSRLITDVFKNFQHQYSRERFPSIHNPTRLMLNLLKKNKKFIKELVSGEWDKADLDMLVDKFSYLSEDETSQEYQFSKDFFGSFTGFIKTNREIYFSIGDLFLSLKLEEMQLSIDEIKIIIEKLLEKQTQPPAPQAPPKNLTSILSERSPEELVGRSEEIVLRKNLDLLGNETEQVPAEDLPVLILTLLKENKEFTKELISGKWDKAGLDTLVDKFSYLSEDETSLEYQFSRDFLRSLTEFIKTNRENYFSVGDFNTQERFEEVEKKLDKIEDTTQETKEILEKKQAAQNGRYNIQQLGNAIQDNLKVNARVDHTQVDRIGTYLKTIFTMSKLEPDEMKVLGMFTLLPPQFHRYEDLCSLFLSADDGKNDLSHQLNSLSQSGWLFYDSGTESYRLHRMLIDLMREMNPPGGDEVTALVGRLCDKMGEGRNAPLLGMTWIPYGDYVKREYPEQLSMSLRAMLYGSLASLHGGSGQLEEAEREYQECLETYRELARVHPEAFKSDVAMTLNNLANLHSDRGHLEEAEREYQECLETYRELARVHPEAFKSDVATTLNNLANLHSDRGQLEEAEREYQECLETYRELARMHPEAFKSYVAGTLNNLANLHSDRGHLEEAERKYQECLDIRRELAREHPEAFKSDVAMTLNNLAALHYRRGHLEEAKREYQESLDIRRELARVHPEAFKSDVATTLNNLAALHYRRGQLEEAEREYQECLDIRRELAREHPEAFKSDVAMTLNNLAALHYRRGHLEEAEREYQESLDIRRELARVHPEAFISDVAMTLNNLAALHYRRGHLEEAKREYQESLDIRRELARVHPEAFKSDVATTLNNLAALHSDIGHLGEAEREYHEALETYRELARVHPEAFISDVAMTLNNLANLHSNRGHLEEAEREYQECLDIRRELAREHPEAFKSDVAMTLNNLANLHSKTGHLEEAEREYHEALEISRELAREHPEVYNIDYANTLMAQMELVFIPTKKINEAKQNILAAIPLLESQNHVPRAQRFLERAHQLLKALDSFTTFL